MVSSVSPLNVVNLGRTELADPREELDDSINLLNIYILYLRDGGDHISCLVNC